MGKFYKAVKNFNNGFFVISEIKLFSPAEGSLGRKEGIIKRAKEYEKAGAGAISVITEKRLFKGDSSFVSMIREKVKIPILQKDFIFTCDQLVEAEKRGADAVLLIAKIISEKKLKDLVDYANKLKIDPVVEVNNEKELKTAVRTRTKIIAVNARDLNTFKVDLERASNLLKKIPDRFVKLGFSGIKSSQDLEKYKHAGADGVLVGTALMRAPNIGVFLTSLIKRKVKVKICGVRNLKVAQAAVRGGADFLGFNFVASSQRFIQPDSALKIIKRIKGKILTVGVFADSPVDYVNKICLDLGLDFVQLHGKENNSYINKVAFPVIKSLKLSDNPDRIKAPYLLLDREKRGEGSLVNLKKAAKAACRNNFFLAGGLTPKNVKEAVEKVRPFAVDVAGGIEANGVQDIKKIQDFIKNAKGILI